MPLIIEEVPFLADMSLRSPDAAVDDFIWNTKIIRSTSKDHYRRIDNYLESKELIAQSQSKFREYLVARNIPLPTDLPELTLSLEQAILNRRSGRIFDSNPLKLTSVAALLRASAGLKRDGKWLTKAEDWPKRATASAGGLYPLEIYLIVLKNVDRLDPGLYHFCVKNFSLSLVDDFPEEEASRIIPELGNNRGAKLVIVITGNFGRMMVKYGRRGARHTIVEVGHVQAHLGLAAAALDINLYHSGGGFDLELESKLFLDGLDETILGISLVG